MGKNSKVDLVAKHKAEEKLIELIKERPLLYVKSHPDHCNVSAKSNAWTRIHELMKPCKFMNSQAACKRVWKNIWGQYLAWKRKTGGTTGDGAGKTPYYRHAESLRQFSDKQFVERTYSNDSDSSEDEVEDSSSSARLNTESNDDIDEIDIPSGTATASVAINDPVVAPTTSSNVDKVSTASTSQQPKPRPHTGYKRNHAESGQDFEQELIETFKKSNSDEIEAFSRSIAIKIRKLDNKMQSEAMFRIHETLYKIENDLVW